MTKFGIKHIRSEKIESGIMYGQFLISSLLPGQGITIGNLLRRVLLNDLGGTSITAIRIPGIKDEFSIIPGVREDILEILLNLKGIIVKSQITDIQFGRLKIKGPGVVTASSIQLPNDLKIINPNHYIATISNSNILEIEFKFEYGRGYKLAKHMFSDSVSEFLQTDAIFMPVQKVDFKIENIESLYDNNNSLTERLFIEIWTNGSIAPEEAFLSASKLIVNLFNYILINKFSSETIVDETNNNENAKNLYGNIAIEELQLSVRAYNCLKRAKINTVADLLKYSPEQLQELRNFGRKSGDEVYAVLKNKLGIIFK
uniref:DNA-directed RNA polymerase subunit alpha n=1 Tax=Toxarium undulatum TaxID=210620 RepID=A0A1D8D9Q3_9STRA|nr:RNA polymerase a-subunit [Toxarium undulatum]AOS86667.1 RNA polymerase a-subunit [Toxarium undulatum]